MIGTVAIAASSFMVARTASPAIARKARETAGKAASCPPAMARQRERE